MHRRTPSFPLRACALAAALLCTAGSLHAQETATSTEPAMETIQVSGSWLGTGLNSSVKRYAGARTVVTKETIEESGATSIGDVLRRIPGVQMSENSGGSGSAFALNIGVRGLSGRFSPRSTILLDGIPLAVAPYGQPTLSFAPVSLNNIEAVDVVRGGGAVRYGPQNVGGIINFSTRAIPEQAGFSGDAMVRYNDYQGGGENRQYSAFLGNQLDNGFGYALLYSGADGSGWRVGSNERLNDLALKWRYALGGGAEVYGKFSYYDVTAHTPGGLTVAQYQADRYQNTRPNDLWTGDRKAVDAGYRNTISRTREFEVRGYYNESMRKSVLTNGSTLMQYQPRDYQVLGIEPRYTQRFTLAATMHDVTAGYRYLRERGYDTAYNETVATGAIAPVSRFHNATDAHALYIDDRIAIANWRITPGVRYEHIDSDRFNTATAELFSQGNDKALPSINVSYLVGQDLTLFANYNTSFGVVQNTQLNAQTPNHPLDPELAKTAEFGTRYKNASFSAEATVFQIRFDNQIQQVGSGVTLSFQNLGETRHEGVETAVSYTFDKSGSLAGLNLFGNYTYTKATLESGANIGNDVPFYSRNTDTVGARYVVGDWSFNLSSTHQTKQYADNANTSAESAVGDNGIVPAYRVSNAQAAWKLPHLHGVELVAGVNNLAGKAYYTRTADGNRGRLAGAPRMVYVQGRWMF